MTKYRRQLANADSIDRMLGIEGHTARVWFRFLATAIPSPWVFPNRNRRPPTDPVNVLLSLGYTWLLNRVRARVEAAGLDPNLGALHALAPGRPSLACDLVEPLRVLSTDAWMLRQLRGRSVQPEDFFATEQGIRLAPKQFPKVLTSWDKNWQRQELTTKLDQIVRDYECRLRQVVESVCEIGLGSDLADQDVPT